MALLAITMIEKYNLPYDTLKCIKMCIIHELGEIYAGDYTPYDKITKEEKHLKESSLTKTDLEEFIRLGEDLGYMDITMQENTIHLYLEALKGEIARTEKEAPAKKKMYQALGLMTGIFLAVMLI